MPATTPEHDERIRAVPLTSVRPHSVGKVEKKGRPKATLHPDAERISGLIRRHRIANVETPLIRQCRRLDKVVDDIAKDRKTEKILRP